MCGILAIFGKVDAEAAKKMARRMSHRGPDERGHKTNEAKDFILCHERLAIMDLHCRQPIDGCAPSDCTHKSKEVDGRQAYVIHNGEIYNQALLKKTELKDHTFTTTCDSEVIVHLYEKYGYDICNILDGVFVFAVCLDGQEFMVARDPIGVKPMYYGTDANGSLYFASEMKCIVDSCPDVQQFPPGHYYTKETGFVRYYEPIWDNPANAVEPVDYGALRSALVEATRKRLMSDAPVGFLLSGGLDSSLTSAIAQRILDEEDRGKLHSFSVGLNAEAPDLVYARKVADFIGTKHHEVYFSAEKGIEAIKKLIWHLESYDITTIRASTPMYFLSRYITKMGIKVVLSGEGSDEILGGYLYFHNAPNAEEFQKETIRRVKLLNTSDVLRADKSTMAHSLEVRVPFLDKKFLDVAMTIQPEEKMPSHHKSIEKYILRKAFDDSKNPWIPDEILWRQKEQFSDGVGYSWIDALVEFCNTQVTDKELDEAPQRFPFNTPTSKEAYYYRTIFEDHFPSRAAVETVKMWTPKWQMNSDPSGRASQVHMVNLVDPA